MGHSLDPLDDRDATRVNTGNSGRHDAESFGASSSGSGLRALSDLDDLDIADGEPDIRGWDVRDGQGTKIGEVDDLIIDLSAMKVRYMAVELDKDFFSLDDERRVLVPIGNAQLDDDEDDVIIPASRESLLAMPAYDDDTFGDDQSTHDQFAKPWQTAENTAGKVGDAVKDAGAGLAGAVGLGGSTGASDVYKSKQFDDTNFFGSRRQQDRQDQSYLRRHEEELNIGKREVETGDVRLHKTVETEHVSKSVPVRREEVDIERRPITGDAVHGESQIGEDEIRIQLMGEEIVTEKRIVPKEEIVVRKRVVEEDETIEADLRRERIDVDDSSSGHAKRNDSDLDRLP